MLRAMADKLWAMGLTEAADLVHAAARKREVLARDALYREMRSRTFERLCCICIAAVDGPQHQWQPMTKGLCQYCGQYGDLMAHRV